MASIFVDSREKWPSPLLLIARLFDRVFTPHAHLVVEETPESVEQERQVLDPRAVEKDIEGSSV